MRHSRHISASRHNVFYFRFLLPSSLHPSGKRTHNKLSLNTRCPRTALSLGIVDFFLNRMEDACSLSKHTTVKTDWNLNSKVFEDIATSLGIDPSPYSTKFNLIDQSLVKQRNEIAHGQYLQIDLKNVTDLSRITLGMLEMYKTDIENIARDKSYRMPIAAADSTRTPL